MTTPLKVRIERDADGGGWVVLYRGHGWQHTDLNDAIEDARTITGDLGVTLILTDGQSGLHGEPTHSDHPSDKQSKQKRGENTCPR